MIDLNLTLYYVTEPGISTGVCTLFLSTEIPNVVRVLSMLSCVLDAPGQKIEMTAPVVIKIDEEKKWFWEAKQYTMSFLLPKEHQANPPMPKDNQVTCRYRMKSSTAHF